MVQVQKISYEMSYKVVTEADEILIQEVVTWKPHN